MSGLERGQKRPHPGIRRHANVNVRRVVSDLSGDARAARGCWRGYELRHSDPEIRDMTGLDVDAYTFIRHCVASCFEIRRHKQKPALSLWDSAGWSASCRHLETERDLVAATSEPRPRHHPFAPSLLLRRNPLCHEPDTLVRRPVL